MKGCGPRRREGVFLEHESVWSGQERVWFGEESKDFWFWKIEGVELLKKKVYFQQMKGLGPDR